MHSSSKGRAPKIYINFFTNGLSLQGLTVFGVAFTLYVLIMLWRFSPNYPFRTLPDGCTAKEKDPGGFIDEHHYKWLGWLYNDFRMEVYYMSAMHLIHRFLFAAVVSLAVMEGMQLLLCTLLTMFFAVLFFSKAPYYSKRLNVLQTVLYTSVLFQFGFGICYIGVWQGNWWSIIEYFNWAMIILVFSIIMWIISMDGFEYWADVNSKKAIRKYLSERKERKEAVPSDKDADFLIDVFSPTRLWRYVY
jgi:Transient receptor potential (TRP) ion channel